MELTINTNAQITDKALNKELALINQAIKAGNTASWSIAKSFHAIVLDELFTADFDSLGNFAKVIGVSKSVISRDVNAYVIGSKLSIMHWTLSAVIELLPLCSKGAIDFEGLSKVAEHLQQEGTPSRNKVRAYVRELLQAQAEPETETEGETETETDGEVVESEEVEALKAEIERLQKENKILSHNAAVYKAQHDSLLEVINKARTVSIDKSEVVLTLDDVHALVQEAVEGYEVEE